MGSLALVLVVKFILFKVIWIIGGILIFLHTNLGLPELFIKFWCGFVIAGFFILLPYCLVQMVNPGLKLNKNRVLIASLLLCWVFWII